MWTSQAERVVPGHPPAVHEAVTALVRETWGELANDVVAGRGRLLVHGVANPGDPAPDVWLTWEFEPHPDGTRVRLLLEELDRGPDPSIALAELLDLLAGRVTERSAGA
jgi:hypothetical protein